MAIFGAKPWVYPFGKILNFSLFRHLVIITQKGVFSFQNIIKKKISWPILPNKKRLEKWPFLDFLNFFFLQPSEAYFRSRISEKTLSWPILPQKKKLEKWPFLEPNHGLNPLEKCQFIDFLHFLFLYPRKGFYRFRIS